MASMAVLTPFLLLGVVFLLLTALALLGLTSSTSLSGWVWKGRGCREMAWLRSGSRDIVDCFDTTVFLLLHRFDWYVLRYLP